MDDMVGLTPATAEIFALAGHHWSQGGQSLIEAIRSGLFEQWDNLVPGLTRPDDISFIQRGSTWLNENGKIVLILFRRGDWTPFAIVKTVRNEQYKNSIEREFNNLSSIWERATPMLRETLPRPLLLECIAGKTFSFETALTGKSLAQFINNHSTSGKKRSIIQVFNQATQWLQNFYRSMNSKNTIWDAQQIEDEISDTINTLSQRLDLAANEKKVTQKIMTKINDLKGQKLPVVCQHGDFGGGAILVGKNNIGIIDWEFFKQRSLPLFDLFKLIIHPGFSLIKRSNYGLMDQFKAVFQLEWYSKLAWQCCAELCHALKINPEIISLLFAIFLIQLTNSHDGLHQNNATQNHWRDIFQYYADICFQKKHTTAPWLVLNK